METVKVSPKYQVVIPKAVRESAGIKPGQEVVVFNYGGRIEVVPVESIKKMRGFLRGVDPEIEREEDRRI
ncbi:MAG: AbrB/MazE/SpoVT family DNA-binding domain-containing protein [Actinomycetota bacterium]|jgi:AbrB family looped-hinge helix DNA binding protein|nr:AbrB/MazE/SpoVT family DNA-binding domain-containing protein [Rubrobacter sp.]MDQ3508378.1 AbrB/MazE/SpoVT family DNA-binding domain-containing protein [Actinomycetota bacterium]